MIVVVLFLTIAVAICPCGVSFLGRVAIWKRCSLAVPSLDRLVIVAKKLLSVNLCFVVPLMFTSDEAYIHRLLSYAAPKQVTPKILYSHVSITNPTPVTAIYRSRYTILFSSQSEVVIFGLQNDH